MASEGREIVYSAVEHIREPVLRFLSDTLDKLVLNFGKDKVMSEYLNPVIQEKNTSQSVLDFLKSYRKMLSE